MIRKNLTKILIGISLILAVGVAVYGVYNNKSSKKTDEIEKFTVPAKDYIFINGVVKPKDMRVYESNSMKGELDSVNVSDGDQVQAGQILMSYRNQEAINQEYELGFDIQGLRTAEANEKELRRKQVKNLETQRANLIQEAKMAGQPIQYSQLPSTDLDTPPTDYESQIAKIERQREVLRTKSYDTDVSDISGTASVEKVSGAQGNQTRITVRSNSYIIEGTVKEKDLGKIEKGMKGKSTFVANNKTYDSKIEDIETVPVSESQGAVSAGAPDITGLQMSSGTGENKSSEYKVVIRVDNPENMTEGFHVQTKVNVDKDDSVRIPKTALLSEKGKKYVYSVGKDNILKKKEVQLDRIEENEAVIKSGLKEKEVIVKKVSEDLKEGDKVE